MTAKDFRKKQEFSYDHFTKLTSTGIIPDYNNIEQFAEEYHRAKVNEISAKDIRLHYPLPTEEGIGFIKGATYFKEQLLK